MLKNTPVFSLLAASAMLAAPGALAAQDTPDRFKGSASLKSRQKPEEMAATDSLNREQLEAAARQIAENSSSREAVERATREREATIARQQAEHRTAVERQQRDHEAAVERWRADVAACEAGDRARCAQPLPHPR
jgi:hypothetical protein